MYGTKKKAGKWMATIDLLPNKVPYVAVVLNNGIVALHPVDVSVNVVRQVNGKAGKLIATMDCILLEIRFVTFVQDNGRILLMCW